MLCDRMEVLLSSRFYKDSVMTLPTQGYNQLAALLEDGYFGKGNGVVGADPRQAYQEAVALTQDTTKVDPLVAAWLATATDIWFGMTPLEMITGAHAADGTGEDLNKSIDHLMVLRRIPALVRQQAVLGALKA